VVSSLSALSERQLPGPPSFRGQILIVGLITKWSEPKESEIARLRSELRCLSSVLVLMGPEQLACFQANDTRGSGKLEAPCDRADFEALLGPRTRPGQPPKGDLLRLAIVNPTGAIAWSHDGHAAPRLVVPSLIAALSQARRHLMTSAGRTYGITRSELMASLTSAFATTFGNDHPLGSLARAAEPREIFDRASGDRC
jgi:hypothetical protein